MKDYLIRRLLLMVPTLIGITIIAFAITRVVPGGPIEQLMMESQAGGGAESASAGTTTSSSRQGLTEEDLKYLNELYGFDKPILIAYVDWMKNVIRLDFGESYRYFVPVWDLISERIPIALYYGFVTTILVYMLCIPLGVMKAVKDKTLFDSTSSFVIFTGYAIPNFVFALLLLVYFGGELEWFPMEGFTSEEFEDMNAWEKTIDIIYHSILPLGGYLVSSFASMTVLQKNTLLESLGSDYIRTAFAKGVPKRKVIFKHALRNSLVPIAATFGHNISLVFTGQYLIEYIFNIDGMGLLGYQSVVDRDYPVVLGTLLLSSFFFLMGNLLSDICVSVVDPRIRFK